MAADRLRFDYSHAEPLSAEQKKQVSDLVNENIQKNLKVTTQIMDLDEAKHSGAIALFDEKYEDKVRVVSMGDFSKELCGGTHTVSTGDIGAFVLLSDESIASGIRRIEALVGTAAIEYLDNVLGDVNSTRNLLKVGANVSLNNKTESLLEQLRNLEKLNESLKEKIVCLESNALLGSVYKVNGVDVISAKVSDYTAKELRVAIDNLKCRLKTYVIVLGSEVEGKVSLIAAVSQDLHDKLKAGTLISEVAVYVGGKGGGRPDMAQAGGSKPEGLDKAISSVKTIIEERG